MRVYPDQIHIDSHDPRLSAEEVGRRQAVLGAALARRRHRRAAAQRVADARRPLRRRPGRVDRPHPRADQPRRQADQPARRRGPVHQAARVSRPRRACDRGAHAPRQRPPGPLGRDRLQGRAGARRRRRATTSTPSPRSPSGPIPTTPWPPPRTIPPSSPSTRACAGWSTSTAPKKSAWRCASRSRCPWSLLRSTPSSWWASATRRRPRARNGWRPCSTPTITPTGWRSSARARRPTTPPRNAPASPAATARGEQSFALEWPDPAPEFGPATDAGRLGSGLGLPAARIESTLGRIAGATASEEPLAAALQTALWPATWGYYLSQFTSIDDGRAPTGFAATPAGIFARRACCRRCGAGASPTASCPSRRSTGFTASGDDAPRAERLGQLLAGLRDQVWRPATFGAAAHRA